MNIVALMLVLAVMATVWEKDTSPDQIMIYNKSQHLALAAQELYGMPASKPVKIIWNADTDWLHGALTNCRDWTLEISLRDVRSNVDHVLSNVMAHEYGHLVHCFKRGGTVGVPAHNELWAEIVTALGGRPN